MSEIFLNLVVLTPWKIGWKIRLDPAPLDAAYKRPQVIEIANT